MAAETVRVHYPAEVFEMPFSQGFAYERFVHNALRIGVQAIRSKGLPMDISLDFGQQPAWTIGASIQAKSWGDNPIHGFHLSTSFLTPPISFALCFYFGRRLFDPETLSNSLREPKQFVVAFEGFAQLLREAVKKHRGSSAAAVAGLYESCGISLSTLTEAVNEYDHLVQFIVNHEFAHVFSGQLTSIKRALSPADSRAFEIIVDTIATEWSYNDFISRIPDTDTYRTSNGFADHGESIARNAELEVQSQLLFVLLCVWANGTLVGGKSHPHGMLRHMIQNVHFMTLLLSNNPDVPAHLERSLDQLRDDVLLLFYGVDAITREDLLVFTKQEMMDDFKHAARLIEEFQIPTVAKVLLLLESMKARQLEL